jgi:tRNA(Ile)-lysidine synthetase-like protein
VDVAEHPPGAGGDRRPDRLGAPGPRLNRAVGAIRAAVRDELADLPPGARVLVACSGGADSLALAAATAFVAPRATLLAGAVVVDHGWSDRSGAVAAEAAAACAALGLAPVETVRVDCSGPGGPEAAARAARYAALDDAARRLDAAAVLLGHTRDDQAETVLLALARGSGQRSLAGMPVRRGRYRRPLLGLPRQVTAQACAALGLFPWADPANADPAYRRSRVRALLPALEEALGPGLVAALARTAELAREDADALDALAAALLDQAGGRDRHPGRGGAGLDVATLAAAPDALRRRALRLAAVRAGSPAGDVARVHVLAMDALVVRYHGQGRVHLPGGVGAVRACGRLVVVAAPDEGPPAGGIDPSFLEH